jgi:hypothetical protein
MRRKTRKRETFSQLIFVQTFYNEKEQVGEKCNAKCSCVTEAGGDLMPENMKF